MEPVYFLNLGCNAGPRLSMLKVAIARLGTAPQDSGMSGAPIKVEAISCAWEGQEGHLPFAPYINVGVAISSKQPPDLLKAHCRWIEDSLGRHRDPERNAPVAMDIDPIAVEASGSITFLTNKNIFVPHCAAPLWEVATPMFSAHLISTMTERELNIKAFRDRLWLLANPEDIFPTESAPAKPIRIAQAS